MGLELGDFLLKRVDVGGLRCFEVLLPAGELLGKRCVVGHRRLPRILAGQVAAVPLGTDRVQVADEFGGADRMDGVVVEHAVVPLMPGRENPAGLLRHAAHLLALMHAVAHELFGEHVLAGPHRFDRRLGVEVERQRDDHRLDVRVGEQVFVSRVDLHLLAGRILRRPLVLRHQPGAGLVGAGAGDVTVKGAEDVVGPDVGDGDDVEVVGIVGPDEHAPLVARAEHADAEWVAHALAVAKVDRAQPGPAGETSRHRAGEEVTPRDGDGIVKVFLADRLLLFGQVHGITFEGSACVNVMRECQRAALRPHSTRTADTTG